MVRLLIRLRRVALGLGLLAAALLSAAPASAQDSVTLGQRVFRSNCAVCHSVASTGQNTIGPNLYGVVGRPAASAPHFAYSPAMRQSGITWTADQILAFVQAPSHVVHGTRMAFAGLHNPQQAAFVVAYLQSLQPAGAAAHAAH
jgi:cytochrome c